MEKVDILLKAREEASIFTTDLRSIQNWLEKSTLDSSSLSIEICHPLATPPHTVLHEETDSLVFKENTLAGKIKEEPMSPGGIQPTPASVSSAETPPKEISLNSKKQTKASPPFWKTSAFRGNSFYCSPSKIESENPWAVHTTICTRDSPRGEAVGRQQEAQSHQHAAKPRGAV